MEKIKRFISLFLATFALFKLDLSAESSVPDNYAALRLCAAEYSQAVSKELSGKGAKEIQLEIEPSTASWALEQSLIESGGQISFITDSARPYRMFVSIESFRVSYADIGGNGLIERVAELKVAGRLRMPSGELTPLRSTGCARRDTLSRSQAEAFNDTPHDFARGELPPESSFIKKYAEPVLAVAVSALAVFLFFTVRSN